MRLCNVFKDQLEIDFLDEFPDQEMEAQKAAEIALNAIVELFHERAIELFRSVFKDEISGITPSLGMFRVFNEWAKACASLSTRTWLINYCTGTLKQPKSYEKELISYLARAFFCFQVLDLDPNAFQARIRVLKDKLCLIDSNVLIPTICPTVGTQFLYKETLSKSISLGISVVALSKTVKEVERAAIWAQSLIEREGEGSIDVLYAAYGDAGYRPNQFLKSFIESASKDCKVSFKSYLKRSFGGGLDYESIVNLLTRELSIPTLEEQDLIDSESGDFKEYKERVKSKIFKIAAGTYFEKSKSRAEIESIVYSIIALWNNLKLETVHQGGCRFLSSGGFLTRLAEDDEIGIEFSPVMTLDGIVEVLRLAEQPEARMEFTEWIKLNYFSTSASLVDDQAARKFFSATIENAESVYNENLTVFREVIDNQLSADYLAAVPAHERPKYVESLKAKADEIHDLEKKRQYYKEKYEDKKRTEEKRKRKEKYLKQEIRRLRRGKKKKKR